ncbi:hypothetical protein F4553_002410 [Allocatelliglobosispora scoriae]|uniref:Uncharacterized protein n=1 Tax=Allocatelliglobosispora scoriae TaxID=643052 RepID=A0A841BQC3_9ACTN|nr:hypothetical protein [Allocatelliglobosispora scoriae]
MALLCRYKFRHPSATRDQGGEGVS